MLRCLSRTTTIPFPRSKKSLNRYFLGDLKSSTKKTVLITTPIFYVNSAPHIGHVYSCLIADALARWHRFCGEKTLFSTGTDEHGLKVRQAAEKENLTPHQFCDNISAQFRKVFDECNISYDKFIRTTDSNHIDSVNHMWKLLEEKDYIYKGSYEGWYSVSDESFVSANDTEERLLDDQKIRISKESGHRVEWLQEENYKFRLSKFQKPLLDWLEKHPEAIFPQNRLNQVKSILLQGLEDISVSRLGNRVKWGIPLKEDPKQIVYVWLDALTNYLTVTDFPNQNFRTVWPADYHVIGKDILKFHAIYWPAFLMAADLPLPKRIITHAHWTIDRVKMSKSLGNVVAPSSLIQEFGLDPVRYFLLKEGGMTDDGDFSKVRLAARLRDELANCFGNLISRATSKTLMSSGPVVFPAESSLQQTDRDFIDFLKPLPERIDALYRNSDFATAINQIYETINEANRYFTKNEPWNLKKIGNLERLQVVTFNTVEAIRLVSLLLLPIIPQSSQTILNHLGVPPEQINFFHCRYGVGTMQLHDATPFVAFAIKK